LARRFAALRHAPHIHHSGPSRKLPASSGLLAVSRSIISTYGPLASSFRQPAILQHRRCLRTLSLSQRRYDVEDVAYLSCLAIALLFEAIRNFHSDRFFVIGSSKSIGVVPPLIYLYRVACHEWCGDFDAAHCQRQYVQRRRQNGMRSKNGASRSFRALAIAPCRNTSAPIWHGHRKSRRAHPSQISRS
jgi:hypothetical protein